MMVALRTRSTKSKALPVTTRFASSRVHSRGSRVGPRVRGVGASVVAGLVQDFALHPATIAAFNAWRRTVCELASVEDAT
jgi:hypothetical protein